MNRHSTGQNISRRHLLRYGVGFIGASSLTVLLGTKAKAFTNTQKVQLLASDPETKQSTSEFGGMSFNKDRFSDFDGGQARELAVLISAAYAQFKQQEEDTWLPPDGFTLIQELSRETSNGGSQVFGFVATRNREAFIIIRGTKTPNETMKDLIVKLKDYNSIFVNNKKWGRTPTGFYLIYNGLIKKSIRKDIEEALPKIKEYDNIFVAGHSLGGALATLTIPDLIDSVIDPSKITVFTFGSPRCSDNELADNLDKSGVKHWRIANTEDPIVKLPLPTRFKHTGTPICFTIGTGDPLQNHNLEEVYMTGIGQRGIEGSND